MAEYKEFLKRPANITLEEIAQKMEKEKANKAEMEKDKERTITKPPKKQLTISERAMNYLYGQSKLKGITRFGSRGRDLDNKGFFYLMVNSNFYRQFWVDLTFY